MASLNHIDRNRVFAQCKKGYAKSDITKPVRGIKSVTAEEYGHTKLLEDVIRENISSKYKMTLLYKISHCLSRLETNQTPLDKLSPPEIRENEFAQEKIIKKLAKTFFHILTGKEFEGNKPVLSKVDCEDHITAQDLIDHMISDEEFTIDDVLLHPLFWSEQDKIIFICNIYDRIVPECRIKSKPKLRKKTKDAMKKYMLDDNINGIIPRKGWIEELILQENETEEIKRKNPEIPHDGKYIIRGCAFKMKCNRQLLRHEIAKFDKNSIFDMMRFFRLHRLCYWNIKIFQLAFGDHNEGYWNFYHRRFPKLLIHLYRTMKFFFDNGGDLSKTIAPYKYLSMENTSKKIKNLKLQQPSEVEGKMDSHDGICSSSGQGPCPIAHEMIETEGESDTDSGTVSSGSDFEYDFDNVLRPPIESLSTPETQDRSTTPKTKIADPWTQTRAANKDEGSFQGNNVEFGGQHCSVSSETQERLTPLEKKVTAIVDCDSKETTARVKKLVEKMINRQPDDLGELEFRFCHLKKEHLEEFLLDEVLNTVVCKILKLSLNHTENVTDLIPSYCRIASSYKTSKLNLIFDDLKKEDIKTLVNYLDKNKEYEEIDMSYNGDIGPDGYENIGRIVEKHKVRTLRLADCDITDVDLHRLFVGMGDAKNDKFMELDISYNRKIKPDGYKNVGNIVKEHEVRTLRLEDCNISDKDLEYLFNGMGEAELEVLDISFTNNVTAKGFAHIGKQVAKNRIKRLNLSDTQLNLETLTAFYNEVADSIEVSEGQQVLVEEIDVSYNSTMEPEAYKVLGSMVKLFAVKKISLAGCGLSEEHLKNLREEMKYPTEKKKHYTKMKSLNAGDNTSIGEAIFEIAKIVNECQLEELDISDCRFSANELKDFIESLGEAELKCLYLGEKRQFDDNYISEVCNLLPHIKKTLRLKGTVRNHSRRWLQKNLNRLTESELEIKLDDDVTLRAQIKDEVTNPS